MPKQDLDVNAELEISFDEAFNGCSKTITLHGSNSGKKQTINLKIPKGTASGDKLKVKGQGATSVNGQKGNLIIKINVLPNAWFRMNGKDVLINLPVTFSEAALGTKVEIPTPQGDRIVIKVPAGCKNGTKLTIKDRGLKKIGRATGKLIAKIEIVTPKNMNTAQTKAMKAFAKVEDKGVRS